MKRWFRMVDGTVVYAPGVSPPNSFFGKSNVGIQTYDQHFYGVPVEESGELSKTVSFLARGNGALPIIPDDLDDSTTNMIPCKSVAHGEVAVARKPGGAIQIGYRAPDENDFAVMLRGKGSLLRNAVIAMMISGALGVLIYAVTRSLIAAAVAGGGLYVSSLFSNLRFFREAGRRKRMATDAKAVEVIHVDASRIMEIEPTGTGAAYVFFAESGEALLTNGQWQQEFDPFPVAQFRIHRWADTKKPIWIESFGSLIFPEEPTLSLRPDYIIGEVELFKARPDTLQQDMDAAFGGKGKNNGS